MEIDKTDEKIIKHLISDSRQSARQLALKLKISTVTALSRIKNLEKKKVIKGYTILLDQERTGYPLTAIIEITAKNGIVDIEAKLSKIENVCCVYDSTGNADAIVIAKFTGRNDLSKFVKYLSSIANVDNTITHLVLNTVKEDFRLS